MRREIRVARRLARLYRIERTGLLRRRPVETARRLIDRRAPLIEELRGLEAKRRSSAPATPIELELTMAALATEVERAEQRCLELLAELGDELRLRRGEGGGTGLRDGADGRLLGQG